MTPTASAPAPTLVGHDLAARRALLEQVVALLSLQPDDSPVHNVEGYGQGLRVTLHNQPYDVHVYALPWARGWSVFATPEAGPVTNYSWRHVPPKYQKYGTPLYTPRGKAASHFVPAERIVSAIVSIVERLAPHDSSTQTQPAA